MKIKEFTKGLFRENPTFVIMLGLCPTLAVSNQVVNAIGMSAAVLFVLLGSNIIISLLKNFIPDKVRIPSYIIVIASFVTIVDLVMQAFIPPLSESLGVFVPLIVVNCIILGRAEGFANRHPVSSSILDALGMGLGFAMGLTLIALFREILGAGMITLFPLPFDFIDEKGQIFIPALRDAPAGVFIAPAGALLVIGLLKAFFNQIELKQEWIREKIRRLGKKKPFSPKEKKGAEA
ncbi:MAG: electron transport complex subunit E [Spirochaetales bacterium]|nr:electron transport complex subunit E [Spirochaetales bacterium]